MVNGIGSVEVSIHYPDRARGVIHEFRRNIRHLTADLGPRCPIYSDIWTCISIDVNFVVFLCRDKDVCVCTLLSILPIIRLEKHL